MKDATDLDDPEVLQQLRYLATLIPDKRDVKDRLESIDQNVWWLKVWLVVVPIAFFILGIVIAVLSAAARR